MNDPTRRYVGIVIGATLGLFPNWAGLFNTHYAMMGLARSPTRTSPS